MFEIGNSLREARLRQGLDFPEIEQATKIRGKYLRALEDEQKTKIKDSAYTYWLQQQKKAHGVQKLVPGHELDA